MIEVRCKLCNTELKSHQTQTRCCGCTNMMTVVGAEVSVAKNIVLFADAKIPFAETGAETFGSVRAGRATYNYGSGQGYNVTGTVGVGIKF